MKLLRIVIPAMLAIGILCAAVIWWHHPNPVTEFEEVFGITPPAGVTNIQAYRRGMPNDHWVLLQFSANREAIGKAIAYRKLEFQPHVVSDALLPDHDVAKFWRLVLGAYPEYGGATWKPPKQLVAPEVYKWRSDDQEGITSIVLLWDGGTGRAYVVFVND